MKTRLITITVAVFILINNFGISNCQYQSFSKSSLLITGGLNTAYYHRELKGWNESFFDIIIGLGYSINARNVCGINLDYEIKNIYDPSYRWHRSELMTELIYKRYFLKNMHLDLYFGLGNSFEHEIIQNETTTDYRKVKYGGNIGKTLFLTDCIALDFAIGMENYVLVLEKYRPDLGNMKIILVNLNVSFIYYFTLVQPKTNHYEKF